MTKFVVTFGPDHASRFRLPDYRGYVEVVAASMTAAREVAFKWLGDQWCNLYAADRVRLDGFPSGCFGTATTSTMVWKRAAA